MVVLAIIGMLMSIAVVSVNKLRKGAQVKSVRGPGGGYLLARHPSEMRISDIILAVDGPIKATRCTPGSPEGCRTDRSRCLTHDLWEELGNQIFSFLNSVSLDDVVAKRLLGIGNRYNFNEKTIRSSENVSVRQSDGIQAAE